MWDNELNVRDNVYGVVTGGCTRGLFLTLENGQKAFSFFGGLRPGTEVLCTIVKKATDKLDTLVSIDSIIAEAELIA